jgi:outer membrane biosynthesis protein TonB
MRPILVTSLLLSPMLLTASAVARSPKTDASTATPVRVSTGLVAPKIIDPNDIHISGDALGQANAVVELSLNVDEKGNAQNVKVVKSASPELDARVVSQVLQSRFRPGTLNNHAIPVDLDLVIKVNR